MCIYARWGYWLFVPIRNILSILPLAILRILILLLGEILSIMEGEQDGLDRNRQDGQDKVDVCLKSALIQQLLML